MLKVKEINILKKVSIKYDIYIPISICLDESDINVEPMIYWRIGDLKKNFVEIGIQKKSKEICSLTVIICENICENKELDISYKSISDGCLKIVQGCGDEKTYIDCPMDIWIYISKGKLFIAFEKIKEVKCVRNDNIEFLLDEESNLCGVIIKEISEKDMNVIKDSLI